jgi:hypothetical protein
LTSVQLVAKRRDAVHRFVGWARSAQRSKASLAKRLGIQLSNTAKFCTLIARLPGGIAESTVALWPNSDDLKRLRSAGSKIKRRLVTVRRLRTTLELDIAKQVRQRPYR